MKAHTSYYPRAKLYSEITWIDQCIGLEVNSNEYSKQARLAFHDDASVLKRGPIVVLRRPMEIYSLLRFQARQVFWGVYNGIIILDEN